MARALNRMIRRKGRVFADRYHAHILASRGAAVCLRKLRKSCERLG